MFFPRLTDRNFRRLLLLQVFLFFSVFVFSQQYNFLNYSVRDGLPQSKVLCEFQDHDGYLWIGTEAGVSRFDGTEFDNYSDENGFPGNEVTAIAENESGVLLATDSGVVVFSEGKFILYKSFKAGFHSVKCFFSGINNETLLGTDAGIFSFSHGKYQKIKTSTPVDALPVECGLADARGNLWVGTSANGLFCFHEQNFMYTNFSFTDQEKIDYAHVRGIVETENNVIWIATAGEGLFSYDGNILTPLLLPEKAKTDYFTCVHKDMFGDIWLGTAGKGVIHYTRSAFKIYDRQNGLGDDEITCITSDRQGNTWFGTETEGLIFFYGNQFTTVNVKEGLPDNDVHGIVQDNESNMWFATSGGLAMYDGLDVTKYDEQNGLFRNVRAVTNDGNIIFCGSEDGNVGVVQNRKCAVFHSPPGINTGEIISMLYTSDGSVWIGTAENGLFRFSFTKNNSGIISDGKFENVSTGNTLLHNTIWNIYESDDGMIWLGTSKGLFELMNGNAVRPEMTGKKQPPFLPVYSVNGDNSFIYFSTLRNGVWRYNRKTHFYQSLDKKIEGIGSDFIRAISPVESNSMYVTHSMGMDRITFTPDSQFIRHFWYKDGIGTDNFSAGVIFHSKDGRVWMGSSDGVIIYTPSGERARANPPQVEIKEVLLFNHETDWSKFTDSILPGGIPFDPVLSYEQNQVTFKLAGIQFGAGVNIRFQYKLEPIEQNWITLEQGNIISFTNLPPGNYHLFVKAGNSNNTWSNPYVFSFSISPPFYATIWFYLSVLGFLCTVGILLVFLYRRFRVDFIRRHRSFSDYQLNTARMVLLFSGLIYPVSLILCGLFRPDINFSISTGSIVSVVLIAFFASTFYVPVVRKLPSLFSQVAYGLLIADVLYINHLNQLDPVTVIILAVALGGGGVVFDNVRSVSVFSGMLLFSVALLMAGSPGDALFNRWLLLLGVVVSIVIMYISVLSRLNLFNRLIFADTAINNSKSLVIAAEESGKIIFVSRSIRSILGYTESEVMGDNWWKVRTDDPEENERMKKIIISQEGNVPVYVAALKAKNGTVRWIQWSDTVLENGIKVGIGVDVTDRKEIEERYRHIVESATDIIFTADYRGRFTFVNDVASKITGYSSEDLLGKHFTHVVRPDYIDEVRNFYANQFRKKTLSSYLEFPGITRDGKVVWIGQTVRILFDEARPAVISGFQAIARDITEKKRYEQELEKLSLVASETINGVLICDPDGLIEWVNEGFTRITGYQLNEVKGKMPGDVLAGHRTDRLAITMVREQAKLAEGFNKEFLVYHKNGNEIWLAVSNTPIVDEHGRVLNQIEIFNDITEKKRYEIELARYSRKLETLNMAKEQLLNSHSLESIAENVLGSLAERINYLRRTSIALFDESAQLIDLVFVIRDGDRKPGKMILPLESFRNMEMLRANQHYLVNDLDVETDHSISDLENLDAGVRSYLVTPLYAQGQLLGTVNIGSSVAYAISEDDIEMIREVADAMAGALLQLRYLGIIEQKNKDISASILYARRIQDAILPPEEMLRDQIGDLFVLFKPKDILSGDFYWGEQKGKHTFLAVVDSTGHGVPGALLSLMGQNLLNQAVHERHFTRPAAILDYLNAGIQHTLNQYKKVGELRDGMDISLCVFENETKKMQFAGAVNPMYIIRDGMLIQSRGNRFSIGSYFDNKMRPFTNQETDLQSGDIIYLFTDGFSDQFGGEEERKFSLKRLRETLLSIHTEEMSVQKRMLDELMKSWMGDNIQTDDVCVIGIRIK
ncbi:MAG: PAS domain S-box protein [Bacteroidetes bacterium]|nr:PAS domain S-box protein [Bacteroidota bacterium]